MEQPAKLCPICKFSNLPEANFCSHCGAPLSQSSTTLRKSIDEHLAGEEELIESLKRVISGLTEPGIAFYLREGSKPIAVCTEQEFVLGRHSSELTGKEPLVDLSPYDAFALGVSRRHALIRRNGATYEITDLDSSNGTWLDTSRLSPQTPYPFKSGAQIRLGKLVLLIVYR
jgi:hypothetical protein